MSNQKFQKPIAIELTRFEIGIVLIELDRLKKKTKDLFMAEVYDKVIHNIKVELRTKHGEDIQ